MKKLLVIFLSFFSLSSFCQHTQVILSDEFKIKEQEYKNQTVGHSIYHNEYFYTGANSGIGGNNKWLFTKLYDVKFAITISKFDKSMNKIKSVDLENGEKLFGPLEPEMFLLNNKLCLAYFQSDNKSSFDLYTALIDESNLTIRGSKKICTIQQENVGISKIESILNAGLVHLAYSPDNRKVLIACNASPNTLLTFIFDDQFNLIKQTKVSIAGSGFNLSSVVLTNDNLECLILDSEQSKKIICISPDGKKSEMKLIASGNLSPSLSTATISKDGKSIYICSTTKQLNEDEMNCNGLLLAQLDCNALKLSKPLVYEFSPEFIETISQKGGGTKHKKNYFMFDFKPALMELDNGNLAVLGSPERVNSETTRETSLDMHNEMRSRLVATTTFEAGPVITFFPNKEGKTFDYAVMPRKIIFSKSQSSGYNAIQVVQAPGISQSYSSFIASGKGNEIVILFNDEEDNLTKGENEKLVSAQTTDDLVLAEAVISADKKLQYRKQIGKNLGKKYTYFIGNVIPTSSSSIIFPIGKEGVGFNARNIFYTNWCFLNIK